MENVIPRSSRRQYWVQCAKPALEGKLGSTFALSNGYLGLRGSHEEMPPWGRPEFYVAGTYAGGPPSLLGLHDPDHVLTHPDRMTPEIMRGLGPHSISTLPNFPNPAAVRLVVGGVPFGHDTSKVLSNERLLEMGQALLRRRLVFRDEPKRRTCVDSRRFLSFADPTLICLQYTVTPLGHDAPVDALPWIKTDVSNPNGVVLWSEVQSRAEPGLNAIECITNDTRVTVSIVQQARLERVGGSTVLELFIVAGELPFEDAIRRAREASGRGFERCLRDHRAAFDREMAGCAAEFDGDAATVQGFKFAQMHLQMAFPRGAAGNRVGVPIKGLTGHGYRFVNFWDLDFHMFPCFLMTKPREARLLLEYRYNQLPAYRENARRWGAAGAGAPPGAQVPWETQASGREETAPWLCLPDREIHISADAAYMFKLYDDLTPDHDAMAAMGAEFILETARFYASRIAWVESRRRFELPGVGCPDQYHTFADNNVFISLMARWNLEYAIVLAADPHYDGAKAKIGLSPSEVVRWREIVSNFYVIEPNADGIIEEFDGFFTLSPDLDGICETFCRHSQAVKQPDVVAAFAYFEHLYPEEIRRKNWRFYAGRTLHGSSLSLPGMAYAAARCGLNDDALDYLHKATRMDLDDVNLDTERGVHVSAGAVQWYTVVYGFGGLTPTRECLQFRPNLPRQWERLSFTVHWQFQRLRVSLTRHAIEFEADAGNGRPVAVKLRDRKLIGLKPGTSKKMKV